MQRNHLFRDTLSVDSSIELALRLWDPGKLYVRAEPLSRMHRERGQCGDRAPPFLGRRRGWCVPHSSPLLRKTREQRTRVKENKRQTDGDSCFEMSRPFGLQPRPVFAIGPWPGHCSAPPEWPRCHTDLLSCWPGIAKCGLLHCRASEATAIGTVANICCIRLWPSSYQCDITCGC